MLIAYSYQIPINLLLKDLADGHQSCPGPLSRVDSGLPRSSPLSDAHLSDKVHNCSTIDRARMQETMRF